MPKGFLKKRAIRFPPLFLVSEVVLNKRLPKSVLLGCILHRIQEHEGLISFCEEGGIFGIHTQITFERDGDGMCWYLSLSATFGKVMVSHIIQAYKLVCEAYGDNFETKKLEICQDEKNKVS